MNALLVYISSWGTQFSITFDHRFYKEPVQSALDHVGKMTPEPAAWSIYKVDKPIHKNPQLGGKNTNDGKDPINSLSGQTTTVQ